MSADESLGYGVTLSSELRSLMLSSLRGEVDEVALGSMAAFLEDLDSGKGSLSEPKVIDIQHMFRKNPTATQVALREEYLSLLTFWGEAYPVQYLLDAHERGIRTHERLRDIPPGKAFLLDNTDGADASPQASKWVRRRVGTSELINGLVPVQALDGFVPQGDLHLFDPKTVVRPLFGPPCVLAGCKLPTPAEQQAKILCWARYKRATKKMRDRVGGAINQSKEEVHVRYSAYNSDEHDVPIDNLDDTAVNGKVVFIADGDTSYGNENSQDYESPVLEDPTWLEVCVLANAMIETTNDLHHVFLEGIEEDEERSMERSDGVRVYRFRMGS